MQTIELPLSIPEAVIYSLEGVDGSGKSTQTRLVVSSLQLLGHQAVRVCSPSETVLGQFLRDNLGTLKAYERHTLFLLDMARIVLDNPKTILIADRWTDSNLVSNKDSSPEESAKWISGLPKPRKTFFLDIDPLIVLRERSESVHDHSADLNKQIMKRERYLQLVKREPKRFVVLNATLPQDSIREQIVSEITEDILKLR